MKTFNSGDLVSVDGTLDLGIIVDARPSDGVILPGMYVVEVGYTRLVLNGNCLSLLNTQCAPDVEHKSKCECGSEAVGSPRHSDWCPKYKENEK
jgi:hypothetical protein